MAKFSFTHDGLDTGVLRTQLFDAAAGGYASFEGWVRNHNEGQSVRHLEYEAFELLAVKEGERIVDEAIKRFGVEHATVQIEEGECPAPTGAAGCRGAC